MYKLIIPLLLLFFATLNAYESEDKLQIAIINKVSKFISWNNNKNKNFIITVLNNPFDKLFDEIYLGQKIKEKDIEIKYITDINSIKNTDILYIPLSSTNELKNILAKVKNKNILTVSDIRGFAQKEGIIQIYFASQKAKLKINLDVAKREKIKISSSLLRIVDVIKKGNK